MTTDALRRIMHAVEIDQSVGKIKDVEMTAIGIEGEARLCVEFYDESSLVRFMEDLKTVTAMAELIDAVRGDCMN